MSRHLDRFPISGNKFYKLLDQQADRNEWKLTIEKSLYSAEQNFLLSTTLYKWQRYKGNHLVPITQINDEQQQVIVLLERRGCTPLSIIIQSLSRKERAEITRSLLVALQDYYDIGCFINSIPLSFVFYNPVTTELRLACPVGDPKKGDSNLSAIIPLLESLLGIDSGFDPLLEGVDQGFYSSIAAIITDYEKLRSNPIATIHKESTSIKKAKLDLLNQYVFQQHLLSTLESHFKDVLTNKCSKRINLWGAEGSGKSFLAEQVRLRYQKDLGAYIELDSEGSLKCFFSEIQKRYRLETGSSSLDLYEMISKLAEKGPILIIAKYLKIGSSFVAQLPPHNCYLILESRVPSQITGMLEYKLQIPAAKEWVPLIGYIMKLDGHSSLQSANNIKDVTAGEILPSIAILRNAIEHDLKSIETDASSYPTRIETLDQGMLAMTAIVMLESSCDLDMLSQLVGHDYRLMLNALCQKGVLYVVGSNIKHSLSEHEESTLFTSLSNPAGVYLQLYDYHHSNDNSLRAIECLVEVCKYEMVLVETRLPEIVLVLRKFVAINPGKVLEIANRLLFDCGLLDGLESIGTRQDSLELSRIACQLLVSFNEYQLIEDMYNKVSSYIPLTAEADYIVFFIGALKQRQEYEAAISVGLDYIDRAGISIKRDASKAGVISKYCILNWRLEKLDIENLINLPLCNSSNIQCANKVMFHVSGAAYMYSNEIFAPLITFEAISGALDNGLVAEHAFAFACYSFVLLHHIPSFSQAKRVGRAKKYLAVAKQIGNRFSDRSYYCRVTMVADGLILPWIDDIEKCVLEVRNAYTVGLQTADDEFALYSCAIGNLMAFMRGMSLFEIVDQAIEGFDHATEVNQATTQANLALLIQACNFGMGHVTNPKHITDVPYIKGDVTQPIPSDDKTVTFVFHYLRANVAVWRFDFENAKSEALAALECEEGVDGQLIAVHNLFLYCYASIRCGCLTALENKRIEKCIKKLRYLNGISVSSFSHYYHCINAMYMSRVQMKNLDLVESHLNRAIENAFSTGFSLDLPLLYLEKSNFLNSRKTNIESIEFAKKSIDAFFKIGLNHAARLWGDALSAFLEPRYEQMQFLTVHDMGKHLKRSYQVKSVILISTVSRSILDDKTSMEKQAVAERYLRLDYVIESVQTRSITFSEGECCIPVQFQEDIIGVNILTFFDRIPDNALLERIARYSGELFISHYVKYDRLRQKKCIQDAHNYVSKRDDQWSTQMKAIRELIDNRQEQLKGETATFDQAGKLIKNIQSPMHALIVDNQQQMVRSLTYHYQDLTNILKKRLEKQSIVNNQHFDIRMIGDSLNDRYKNLAEAKDIELSIKSDNKIIYNDAFLLTQICSCILNQLFLMERSSVVVRLYDSSGQTLISISDSVQRTSVDVDLYNQEFSESDLPDPFGLWKVRSLINATKSNTFFVSGTSSTTLIINVGCLKDAGCQARPLMIAGQAGGSELQQLLSIFEFKPIQIDTLASLFDITGPVDVICTAQEYDNFSSQNNSGDWSSVNWIVLTDKSEFKRDNNCYFVRRDSGASIVSALESLRVVLGP